MRRRLLEALSGVALHRSSGDGGSSDDELAEVDLTKFEFSEDMIDWSPPDAPHLPLKYGINLY